jgi:sugar-specific transcriptional regulator TrmB
MEKRVGELTEVEKLLSKLQKFDLSDLGAKLYLTLLAYGTLTPVQAADRSGIPRPRTYDELASLERNGLVVRAPAKPMRYSAVPPQDSFPRLASHISDEYSKKINELSGTADDLVKDLQPIFDKRAIGPSDIAWIVTGARNIKDELSAMLSKTGKQFFASYSPELDLLHRLQGFNSTIEKLRSRGVNFISLFDLSARAIKHAEEIIKVLGPNMRFCKRLYEPLGIYARGGEQILIACQSSPASLTYDIALNLVKSPLTVMLFEAVMQPWKQGISITEAKREFEKTHSST